MATSALPGAARARSAEQTDAVASSVSASKSSSATKSDGAPASWPAALERVAQVVGQQVEADVRRPRGRDVERAQPTALVRLGGRPVHFEPAHCAASEAQPAPVVAGAEEHDLRRATAECARHLGVDHLGSSGQCGRPAEGDAHPARYGAVEAALRLDVAARRGRARAVQSEPLCRDPARLQ